MGERRRQSLGAGYRNWRESEHGFWTKIRLVGRNNVTKIRTKRSCCGHHGEPGC